MNIQRSSPSLTNLRLGLVRRFRLNVSDNQKQNHYDSLGITPKATQGDIKTAYYKLSKEYHPDLNEGNESAAEKFRNITAAYEVLSNVKSRKTYDRDLLVGTHQHEYEGSTEPVETYQHASFYHHRNKPASRKTQTDNLTNYNIDEWTRAHYSKTFEKRFEIKTKATYYKSEVDSTEKENMRTLPTLSIILVIGTCFLMYGADATKKYDHPSEKNDNPD